MKNYKTLVTEAAEKYANAKPDRQLISYKDFLEIMHTPEAVELIEHIAREAYYAGFNYGYEEGAYEMYMDLEFGNGN